MQTTVKRTNVRAEVQNRLRRKNPHETNQGQGQFLDARNRFLSSIEGYLFSLIKSIFTSYHLLIIPLASGHNAFPVEDFSALHPYYWRWNFSTGFNMDDESKACSFSGIWGISNESSISLEQTMIIPRIVHTSLRLFIHPHMAGPCHLSIRSPSTFKPLPPPPRNPLFSPLLIQTTISREGTEKLAV